jgi:hypothetical protein
MHPKVECQFLIGEALLFFAGNAPFLLCFTLLFGILIHQNVF